MGMRGSVSRPDAALGLHYKRAEKIMNEVENGRFPNFIGVKKNKGLVGES